jgi:hypothetical protein
MDPASTYLSAPVFTSGPTIVAPPAGNRSGTSSIEVFPSLDASVLIYDELGNAVGFVGNTVIREIPGAVAMIPPTGAETPPYSYILDDGFYNIVMNNFVDSVSHVFIFTDSSAMTYRRLDAAPGQTDRFTYDGGLAICNPDTVQKEINVSTIIIEDTSSEKVYYIAGCLMSQADSMRFDRANHDELKVVNAGVQKTYDLYLELASSTTNPRFAGPGITLDASSSHRIVPVWTNLQTVAVYIDLGNNGTIDDTLIVNNTVDVDDQGWRDVPGEFDLAQNYPNPFNPTTTIRYSLPTAQRVNLTVFNIIGQVVAILVDEEKTAGRHSVVWDASGFGSGVYLCRLNTPGFNATRKLMVIK